MTAGSGRTGDTGTARYWIERDSPTFNGGPWVRCIRFPTEQPKATDG